VGGWGVGLWPQPQNPKTPIPNPQSPNPYDNYIIYDLKYNKLKFIN